MLSLATALQIYGIAIAVSMFIAVLIKMLVVLTIRTKLVAKAIAARQKNAEPITLSIPAQVVAAISAAVSIVTGQHNILHIAESKRSWANEGHIAQYFHLTRH